MKKYLFMAAVAGLTLTSCSQEELSVPTAENNEITFALPVVGKNTRAVTETGIDYAVEGQETDEKYDFGVWAKYNNTTSTSTSWTAGQFYIGKDATDDHGVKASYKSSVSGWAFATPYYWPKNGDLSFIAYAPWSVNANATVTGKGIKFTNYTVGDAADVDLLFSEVARNKKSSTDEFTTNRYKGVHIQFKHALSSVRFAVKTAGDYDGTTIKVKNIKVLNAYSVGDFDQGLADNATAETADGNPCWSGQKQERSYTAFNSGTPDKEITVEDGDAKYVHNGNTTATTNKTDLILLPQALVHTGANTVTVEVTYTITSPSGNVLEQVTTLPLSGEWFRGYRYTYKIVFGLDEIYLDPTVDTWEDVTPSTEVGI